MEQSVPKDLVIAQKFEEMGYGDVLVLTHETSQKVGTEKRTEIIKLLESEEIDSVSNLADKLDRDKSRVSKDLKVLYEADVIEFKKGNGRGKKPKLKHDTIISEPLVFRKN